MSSTMMRTVFLSLVVLVGCSGAQSAQNDIPAAARPLWEQCRPSIDSYCHNRAQGDPSLERECEATTAHDYGVITDDAARRQYLRTHGCTSL